MFDLAPPFRNRFLSIQNKVKPVVELIGIAHGPLVHVALRGAAVTGVLAGGDAHPVAAAGHPSHGPEGRALMRLKKGGVSAEEAEAVNREKRKYANS